MSEEQIVLAARIAVDSPDFRQLEPTVDATASELERAGITGSPEVVVADAGYWHHEQMDSLAAGGVQVLIPPDAGKRKSARAGWQGGRYAGQGPGSRRAGPERVDMLGVLRALERAGVHYVLIGELAEALHGSPLLPVTGTVTIVPRAGQRDSLTAVIAAAGGQPMGSSTTPAIDVPARFALAAYATELVLAPAPTGTQGHEDLRRDATEVPLDEDLEVTVASLVDLVRLVEASEDRARVPALRRTLELATAPPAARAA